MIKRTKRKLPHWTLEGSVYFVTFTLIDGYLTEDEQGSVYDHILTGHKKFYVLITFVVMPNHVHILFTLKEDFELSRVMKGIKGVSSYLVNIDRDTTGRNWLDESYDRIIRDEKELHNVIEYIRLNPFKAGLVEDPKQDYLFYYYNNN